MSCCPEPQVVSVTTCNTFNTTEDAAGTPVLVFQQAVGSPSGYVTLVNYNASGDSANVSTDSAGTNIIATADPDNSVTVYVESLQELYVFSTTAGTQVLGQVVVNAIQTARP
ncbi:S-Ena type endospore appendage [Pontibacillus salipaludis]|uniref:S-Ena type endospore appendage n=1 Tax=Pontibacillus salipaludis TaxID=1697394 RepID=UPI0031E85B97